MEKIKKSIIPIIKIISFICLFILLFTYISYMSKPMKIDLQNIAGLYGEKENSIDVVYIGGSACFVYYEPLKAWEDYGIVVYDYGANTIMPEIYKNMIIEVLKTQKPKLIILDSRAFQYREDENISHNHPSEVAYRNTLTGMKFSLNKINFIKNNIKKYIEDDKLSYYFDLIKYHKTISYNKQNLEMMQGKYKMPYRGFHFVKKHLSLKKQNFKTDERENLPEETNKIFDELLEYIKQTNTDYLFVVSPYIEEIEHKKIFNTIEEKVNEYGYKFLDANEYTDAMSLDYNTDFYNNGHINIFGADKYTDFLSKYIIENYEIPNRKEDKEYEYMNENLEEWHKEVENTKNAIYKIIEESKNDGK
ncbi:MAG: hypothetical protein J5507_02735 [Clostridia bacterium]|nr:hypothetical protein [Clostridia bacterium]